MNKSDLISRVEWLNIILVFLLPFIMRAGITWLYIIFYPVGLLWMYNISRLIYAEWKEDASVIKIWKRHWLDSMFYICLICMLIADIVDFFR